MSRSNKPAPPGMELKRVAGDHVLYSAGEWPATILAKHSDGTFTIEFEESGRTKRVKGGSLSYAPLPDMIAVRKKMCRDYNDLLMRDAEPSDWCTA